MRRGVWIAILLALVGAGTWFYYERKGPRLPRDLSGTLVFVSDRLGTEYVFLRHLPGGEERRLTTLPDVARDPAISPDGTRVAVAMGGRIALISIATGQTQVITLGVDWRDSSPSWFPDGKALVVASRRADDENADIHVLYLEGEGVKARRPLTRTPGLDESSPVVGPTGQFVVYVRENNIFRLDLDDQRPRRLMAGFRTFRSPRFLPSGKLLCLWTQGKIYGMDVIDAAGKSRETIWQGSVYYRTVAPSPDGKFLAATFTFDLGFHPADALRLRQVEEIWLLDAQGNPLGNLARSQRYTNHSADWGR